MISEYLELIESFKENQFSVLIQSISDKVVETLRGRHFNPRLAPYLENMHKEGVPFTDFDLDPENVSQIKKLINALYYAKLSFVDLEKLDIRNISKGYSNLRQVWRETIHNAYQASYLITHLDVDIQEIFKGELELFVPAFTKLQVFANSHTQDTKEIVESIKTYPISHKVGEVSGMVVDQMKPDPSDWNYEVLTKFSGMLPGYIGKLTEHIEAFSSKIKNAEPTLNNAQLEEIQTAALKLLSDLENIKGNGLFVPLKVLNYIHIIRNIITLSTSALEQMGNFSNSSQDVIRDKLAELKYVALPSLFGLVDKIEDNAMLQPGTISIPLMQQIKPLYDLLIYYASKPVNFQEKGEELLSIEDSRFLSLRLENTYKRIDVANKALFKIQKAQDAFDEFYKILSNEEYSKKTLHDLPQDIRAQLINLYKLLSPYMHELDVEFDELLVGTLLHGESNAAYFSRPLKWLTRQLPSDHVRFILAKRTALENLITKKRETQLFHIQLNEDLLHSVHRQTKLRLAPFSDKTNVFSIDETGALSAKEIEKSKLQFKQENGQTLLANPDNLKSDQALELHQWYKNKHNKFMVASKAYFEFMEIIKPHSAPFNGTNVNILQLSALSSESLEKCKSLYNVFQPYFINGTQDDLKKYAVLFDKQLVRALNKDEHALRTPLINFFEQQDKHFQVYFTRIDLEWKRNNTKYLKIANDKFKQENEAASLKRLINVENRAHYVIKHTRFSKMMHDLRKEIGRVSVLFNNSMKAELRLPDIPETPTQLESRDTGHGPVAPEGAEGLPHSEESVLPELPKDIPYPELQNTNQELSQPKQAVAFKRILNSLYHVEKIIAEMEKLNNQSSETRYVFHLLQAYDHINEIKHLGLKLGKDSHFRFIAADLLEKIQRIIATAQEHTYSYQVGPDDIPYNDKPIENNSLWYTLNTFYILPKHIISLRNDNYLTTEELENLHIQAKKANITIENVIRSSDSYFRLFLQSPAMFSLYREMTKKLHQFLSASHDTVMNNLGEFNSKIFVPMLMEADAWESKLCLKPGLISGPLKNIIDEYYKGLLNPLKLPSSTHINLACDMAPINVRIAIAEKQFINAKYRAKKLDKNYEHIIKLHDLLKKYKVNHDAKTAILPVIVEEVTEQEIIKEYRQAIYKLAKLKPKLPDVKEEPIFGGEIDRLLNADREEYHPPLTKIFSLVNSSYHYYLGLKNTYALKLNTATEKLNYLNELKRTQTTDNLQFIEDYTVASFKRQVDILCNEHIGLQYTYSEYNEKLRDYLLTFEKEIVQNSKATSDINLSIKHLLKEKSTIFKNEHFTQFNHLDKIEGVLGQFRAYFDRSKKEVDNGSSTFESDETLVVKTKRINTLDEISKNRRLTIAQRIEAISDQVIKDANFERVMLSTDTKESFSFAQIKQLFFKLLELLFYTPERKALLNNLKDTVKPKVANNTSRFGLFSPASTAQKTTDAELPTRVETKPEQQLPVPQATVTVSI